MIHNSGSDYYCGPDLGIQHTHIYGIFTWPRAPDQLVFIHSLDSSNFATWL